MTIVSICDTIWPIYLPSYLYPISRCSNWSFPCSYHPCQHKHTSFLNILHLSVAVNQFEQPCHQSSLFSMTVEFYNYTWSSISSCLFPRIQILAYGHLWCSVIHLLSLKNLWNLFPFHFHLVTWVTACLQAFCALFTKNPCESHFKKLVSLVAKISLSLFDKWVPSLHSSPQSLKSNP